MKTPVLLLVFNRPEYVRQSLSHLRSIQPSRLFISGDGPRASHPDDVDKIKQVRRVIEQEVDWECELITTFRKHNGGCKLGVSQGISWFFQHVEHGIILEDDCIPHPSFYQFCGELLERYADNEGIFSIMGANILQRRYSNDSYIFTPHMFCWGWATWRRAWKYFDLDMYGLNDSKTRQMLLGLFEDESIVRYWTDIFHKTQSDEIDSWANRWVYACFYNQAMNILSNVNLVTNVGFGFNADATHTKLTHAKHSIVPSFSMKFPLRHPTTITLNRDRARFIQQSIYQEPLLKKLWHFCYGSLCARIER